MRLLYVLPKENYFAEGRRGRVSHALGVVAGLTENGADLTVVSGRGLKGYVDTGKGLRVVEVTESKNRWLSALVDEMRRTLSGSDAPKAVIIRYAFSNSYRFRSIIREFPNVLWCFEVNSLGSHNLARLPRFLTRLIKMTEVMVLDKADLAYVVSKQLKEDLTSGGLEPESVVVVPNGGPKPFDVVCGAGSGRISFRYLGMFQRYYELRVLVDAFATAKRRGLDAELHLYGDGPLLGVVKEASHGINDIHLHGRYSIDALVRSGEFSENTVLVLPLNGADGGPEFRSPIKLFEYMALGFPIIASSEGQLSELLRDGENARLYRAGDVEALASAMESMQDPRLRKRLREAARRECPKHTWGARMDELLQHLKRGSERKQYV